MKDILSRIWKAVFPLFAATTLAACTVVGNSSQVKDKPEESVASSSWLESGSITIAKSLPSITALKKPTVLGFIPDLGGQGPWIEINRKENIINLMTGEKSLHSIHGKGLNNLSAGEYHLLHKQRRAPWYAPIAYFVKRKLPVPPEGDRARFLRGALGNFVLFIDNETPIHSGPIWSEDVGGILLKENDLARLYYQLEIGSAVKIQ